MHVFDRLRRPVPSALHLLLLVTTAGLLAGCGGDEQVPTGSDDADRGARAGSEPDTGRAGHAPAVRLVEVGRFEAPVHAVAVPGTDLVAVVEKGGRLLVVEGLRCGTPDTCPDRPATDGTVVLDIAGQVSAGSEQGLLGFAFHPRWPDDSRIFINYTDTAGDTRVEAWRLETPTGQARRERELLRIDQPFENHNGGHLVFGPDDLLYIGTGDGGSAGDPGDRAQQVDDRLGKLLRVDVDAGGERGYGIPAGNAKSGAEEVWAIGLRNPWRFSFDSQTGDLWVADVGQDAFEEIDALPAARIRAGGTPNFGWRRREGFSEFDTSGATGPGKVVEPVLDYGRDDGCSVTGGVVYRGELVPELEGWYLFADFCADDLRLLEADGVPGSTQRRGELEWSSTGGIAQVASFGEVQGGEVLVVSLAGSIHQVLPA